MWSAASTGIFSLKSAWDIARVHHEPWPWEKLIWHSVIPKTYSILCWRVLWKKLPTLDHVKQFHPEIDQLCCLCEAEPETVSHLFLECTYTRDIWRRCCEALHLPFDLVDISLEMVALRIPQMLGSTRGGAIGRLTILTWIFSIWEEQNTRTFDCKSRHHSQVENTIACRVCDIWEAHNPGHDEISELLIAWRPCTIMPMFEPP